MKKFIGKMEVKAVPMTYGDAFKDGVSPVIPTSRNTTTRKVTKSSVLTVRPTGSRRRFSKRPIDSRRLRWTACILSMTISEKRAASSMPSSRTLKTIL